mmetsp:Transcript_174929/g.560943  ORF Transcript_174929/g.560943 Transcript_174929/m.560943 type:complete len:226 (-) Transcript_174929:311-988(-)
MSVPWPSDGSTKGRSHAKQLEVLQPPLKMPFGSRQDLLSVTSVTHCKGRPQSDSDQGPTTSTPRGDIIGQEMHATTRKRQVPPATRPVMMPAGSFSTLLPGFGPRNCVSTPCWLCSLYMMCAPALSARRPSQATSAASAKRRSTSMRRQQATSWSVNSTQVPTRSSLTWDSLLRANCTQPSMQRPLKRTPLPSHPDLSPQDSGRLLATTPSGASTSNKIGPARTC